MTAAVDHVVRDWRHDAACATEPPELFEAPFRTLGRERQAAVVCARCPVAETCFADAVANGEQATIRGGRRMDKPGHPLVPLDDDPEPARPVLRAVEPLPESTIVDDAAPESSVLAAGLLFPPEPNYTFDEAAAPAPADTVAPPRPMTDELRRLIDDLTAERYRLTPPPPPRGHVGDFEAACHRAALAREINNGTDDYA